MSVLQKLIDLKRVLDWNLATRSHMILPIINDCIKELQEETPVVIEAQKKIKEEQQPKLEKLSEATETVVEVETTPKQTITEPIEEIKEEEKEDKTELVKQYIDKYGKKPFAGRSVEVLKSKL